MDSFSVETDAALSAKSEKELESAGELFEHFIELIQNEEFDDFESLYRLANFLVQGYWPESGMFAEVSSQLFAEYDIGMIDWIWENSIFMDYCLKFMKSDLHFGCFVLTEGRSNAQFTEEFAKRALTEECNICEEIGDGWLGPKAYICEEQSSSTDLLMECLDIAFTLLDSQNEFEQYESLTMLRSLAGNSKVPSEVLEKLTQIDKCSIRHEIRNANAEMDSEEALEDSNVGWKARETLLKK
jgi:hypothetical protein